jgi:amidase
MTENLSRKTAVELASLIATKAVSPVEVLDAHLATIARVNPKLNAIVTLVADGALVLARQAEAAVMRGERLGSLHGLPVAIKDVTPTAGIRTTYGSPLFKDNVPTEDAEAVRRLKAAQSCWARPTPRNLPPAPTPSTTCSASPAIPGIRR